jgi:chorismate synthase
VAASFLSQLGIELVTHTVAIGQVSASADSALPTPRDLELLDEDPVRCFDKVDSSRMVEAIDECHKDADTLGGVTETLVYGAPPGLGSFVHWDRRLDSQLAGALMGIQAIKGVEFGDGFETAKRRGSAAHDEIVREEGVARRLTDRAGGIEGGMSNGEVIRVRVAMKPISTVPKSLKTIDVATGEAAKAQHQRSDVCAVPAAGVVAEAMVALVVANSVLEKFGGDSVSETKRNMLGYLESIPAELRSQSTGFLNGN